jgi:hypothetical protein
MTDLSTTLPSDIPDRITSAIHHTCCAQTDATNSSLGRSMLIVAALALVGCSPTTICAAGMDEATLTVPTDVFLHVVSVRGDTCTATGPVRANVVLLETTKAKPCHVYLTLDDGSVLESTVDFQAFHDACASGISLVDASPFEQVDGGG